MNSALMNLFLKQCHWLYLRPYMNTVQAVPANSSDVVYVHSMFQLLYECDGSKVFVNSSALYPEIITFYSLYNYQSIFYYWHIKPIGPWYSSIMDIWHHGGRQFCVIPGDKALFCFEFKKFQGFHPKYAGLYCHMPAVNAFSCFIGFFMG